MQHQLTQKTVEALLAVREAIAIDGGKSFDMECFYQEVPCGTTLCIAGHLAVYAGATPRLVNKGALYPDELFEIDGVLYDPLVLTEQKFGISPGRMDCLFYSEDWPEAIQEAYHEAWSRGDEPAMARAGQAAIDWFIEKYGPTGVMADTTKEIENETTVSA